MKELDCECPAQAFSGFTLDSRASSSITSTLYKAAKAALMLRVYKSSPQEAEVEGLLAVQGYPGIHSELKASLNYFLKPCLKRRNMRRKSRKRKRKRKRRKKARRAKPNLQVT